MFCGERDSILKLPLPTNLVLPKLVKSQMLGKEVKPNQLKPKLIQQVSICGIQVAAIIAIKCEYVAKVKTIPALTPYYIGGIQVTQSKGEHAAREGHYFSFY